MEDFSLEFVYEKMIELGIEFGLSILTGLVILFVGFRVVRYLMVALEKLMDKYELEPSLRSFLKSLTSFILKLILIIVVAGILGFETTSLIALLGAGGLAIGLALQGSLSNFAGGVIILSFKPFKVEDVIQWGDDVGLVENISILYTELKLFDNKVITVPNGQLANSKVINYTRKDRRRVEMKVGISYSSSIPKAREIVLNVLKEDSRILPDPAPVVLFTNFGDSSLDLSIRVWAMVPDFWPIYWENMEKIKQAFDENGITIPFPQRDVNFFDRSKKSEEQSEKSDAQNGKSVS